MHTTRLLTVSGERGSASGGQHWGGLSKPVEGLASLGGSTSGGGSAQPRGICILGGLYPGGQHGGGVGQTPLWTEFLTHASENIILPQLRCGW